MGYSLSWLAIKGGTPETVHALLQLRPTGKTEDFPESDVVGAELPVGWYVVVFNKEVIRDGVLKQASASSDVVCCFVEEHEMISSVSEWRSGTSVWSVSHDAQNGIFHLEVTGEVPPGLAKIREKLTEEQNRHGGVKSEVDYIFDIPIELAKSLTGFRHDQDVTGMPRDAFHILSRTGNHIGDS